MGKRVQNPRPIVFGIRVLTETLSQWDCEAKAWSSLLRYPTDGHRDSKWNRKSFDGKWICRIVLAIRQSLRVENPVAAVQSRSLPKTTVRSLSVLSWCVKTKPTTRRRI
jgi:hypothetical protein